MPLNDLSVVVSLLVALSIASERLVSTIKGLIPFLNQENPDPIKEGRRGSILQTLAVISGIVTALLARPVVSDIVPKAWNSNLGLLALGLLASGGSGFWNSIQGYVNQVKDIKKLQVEQVKKAVDTSRIPPNP